MAAAAAPQPVRVFVSLCGQGNDATHVEVSVPNDFPAFLETASQALKSDGLKRAFLANGTEITSTDKLGNSEEVFLTKGEDFSLQLKKQVLHQIAAQMVSFIGASSDYVKSVAPAIVANSIATAEVTAKKLATTPIGVKAIDASGNLLGWADNKLDMAFERFERVHVQFINSEFSKMVNTSLMLPVKERGDAFYARLMETYTSLDTDKDGKVSLTDFHAAMQKKVGSSYNNLVEPAKHFFHTIQHEMEEVKSKTKGEIAGVYCTVKSKLGSKWEQSVAKHYVEHLKDGADSFYRAALKAYETLDVDGDGKVSVNDFVVGIRVNLGSINWNEKLQEAAKYLHGLFAKNAPQPPSDSSSPPPPPTK